MIIGILLIINPCNTSIPIIEDWDFFFNYRELFLDLVIPIIDDLLYFEQMNYCPSTFVIELIFIVGYARVPLKNAF